jgi:hypothetical protein
VLYVGTRGMPVYICGCELAAGVVNHAIAAHRRWSSICLVKNTGLCAQPMPITLFGLAPIFGWPTSSASFSQIPLYTYVFPMGVHGHLGLGVHILSRRICRCLPGLDATDGVGHFKPQGALSQHRGANSLLRWVLLRSRCQFSLLDHQTLHAAGARLPRGCLSAHPHRTWSTRGHKGMGCMAGTAPSHFTPSPSLLPHHLQPALLDRSPSCLR